MTFVRFGRRKARFGIQARSSFGAGGPVHAPTAASIVARAALAWSPARIVAAALFLGESADMFIHAAAVVPGAVYWGDAGEMEATGDVVR